MGTINSVANNNLETLMTFFFIRLILTELSELLVIYIVEKKKYFNTLFSMNLVKIARGSRTTHSS